MRSRLQRSLGACGLPLGLAIVAAHAQTVPAGTSQSTPAQPVPPKDALGRDSPRGTVLGFLNAARRGENDLASQYLHSNLTRQDAGNLSHRLFVVLDARLPARLTQLSDAPDGSRSNPLMPNEEIVGVIESAAGEVQIVVDRVTSGKGTAIWLFSEKTLESVPALYEEITHGWGSGLLGRFLNRTRFGRPRYLEWLVVLLGVVLLCGAMLLLNRILAPLIRLVRRRGFEDSLLFKRDRLPRVFARDWNHFLEIQEQLLFAVTAIVERAGTGIAFPSQTMYLAGGQASLPADNAARPP